MLKNIVTRPAAAFMRAVNTYPLGAYVVTGIVGEILAARNAHNYNAIRIASTVVGLVGSGILLFYGDMKAPLGAKKIVDNQDRPVSRLRRLIDFKHYPVEAGFLWGTIEAGLLVPSGILPIVLPKLGSTRPLDAFTGITDLAALAIMDLVKEIDPATPRPPAPIRLDGDGHLVIDLNKTDAWLWDIVERHPSTVSRNLFQIGAVSFAISGALALDGWQTAAGLIFAGGNEALRIASKRNQGMLVPE